MQSAPTPGVLDEIQMDNKKNGKRQKPWFLVMVLEKPFSKTNKVKFFLGFFFFFEKVIVIQKVKYVLIYLLTSNFN